MNARSLSVLAGVLSALAVSPSAFAVSGCTNTNLSGSYAMPFSGAAAVAAPSVAGLAVAPAATPQAAGATGAASGLFRVAGAARLGFDGAGNIAGYSSANVGGVWTQGSLSGTYNVNPDCTFTVTLADANGGTSNYSGVLTAESGSAVLMQTDAGTGFSGTLFAIRNACQTSDLSGAYGLQYSGAGVSNGAPYSSIGVVSLDGQGNLAGAESRIAGSAPAQVQSAGSISVAADCSLTMSLSSTNSSVNFFGFPSADGKRLVLVRSDAGTAASGTAVAQ